MADFDDVMARIGRQLEEMKERIQSSRRRAGHSLDTREQEANHPANRPRSLDEKVQHRTEER